MTINDSFSLSYARFRFTMVANEDAKLPLYLGSTLRGAMGHALRQLLCNVTHKDCLKCHKRWECAFIYIMSTSRQEIDEAGNIKIIDLPHPYIIEPPEHKKSSYRKGEELSFNLLLIGSSINLLPVFIAAFIKAGQNGLGKERFVFTLSKVEQELKDEYELIWANGSNNLFRSPLPIVLEVNSNYTNINKATLILHTPTRLVDKGRLEDSPEFPLLMRAIFRRLDALSKIHCQIELDLDFNYYLERAKLIQITNANHKWLDWERYSSRQSSHMKLGGIVGEISYEGDLDIFIPYLKMAEVLHVGKNTSFGLGRYTLDIG